MEQHQQTLADAVALIVARPEASPLAHYVRCPSRTSADGLVHAELEFDHATVGAADRQDLPGKDDISLIRKLMKNVDNGLRLHNRLSRRNLTVGQWSHQQRNDRKCARQE
jgi:hypothetical protein